MEDIGARIEALRERIARAAARSGRDPGSVRLMAVSKFRRPDEVRSAYAAGMRLFGESRVAEAADKSEAAFSALAGTELHMIGHLQSNKARAAVRIFSCVQSVDSARLALILDDEARSAGKMTGAYFEVHTAEESKAGFRAGDELWRALDDVLEASSARGGEGGLEPAGLMTMAPFTSDEAPVRASFRALAAIGREWERRHPELPRPTLSMGMSDDFEIAIEEGSDMVRIGTAIFGARA